MDPSEACDVLTAVLANIPADPTAGKATLEGMSIGIQRQIIRHFLKSPETIAFFPQDTYINRSWGFGFLGILSRLKAFLYNRIECAIWREWLLISEPERHVNRDYSSVGGPVDSPINMSWLPL